MAINRQFGRDLSSKLMNGAFAGLRRVVKITNKGEYDPLTGATVDEEFNGLGILTTIKKSSPILQNITDAEFTLKVRCEEVVDDNTNELMEVTNSKSTMEVEKLDPRNDSSLGVFDAAVLSVSKDGADAVYTIIGKFV